MIEGETISWEQPLFEDNGQPHWGVNNHLLPSNTIIVVTVSSCNRQKMITHLKSQFLTITIWLIVCRVFGLFQSFSLLKAQNNSPDYWLILPPRWHLQHFNLSKHLLRKSAITTIFRKRTIYHYKLLSRANKLLEQDKKIQFYSSPLHSSSRGISFHYCN